MIPSRRPHVRVRAVAALACALALPAAGCGGSGAQDGAATTASHLKIGMEVPLTGVYHAIGADMRDGFQTYLDAHGGKLGGHPVDLVLADEGADQTSAAAAARKLLTDDHALAIAGLAVAGDVAPVAAVATQAHIPVVNCSGRPAQLPDLSHLWTTSFLSTDPGLAFGQWVAQNASGPVFAIAANYPGGVDEMKGFTTAFARGKGVLANPGGQPRYTPFPTTPDFKPYFDEIAATNARSVYAFFGGDQAVQFVKQFADSQLPAKGVQLYAPGFLTEGDILAAEGPAANGITEVLNYSPDTDNLPNRAFVAAWASTHDARQPSVTAVDAYDAAAVLDQAIAKAGTDPTGEQINTAISTLDQVDSPRGFWQLAQTTHSPVQQWYLRKVQLDGSALANVKIATLGTFGGELIAAGH